MSTEDRKLILVEAVASPECSGYGDEYDSYEPSLTLSTKEITLDELFKAPWVVEELQKRGWVNAVQGKELSEKVTYGTRFYVVVGSPPSWHSALLLGPGTVSTQQADYLAREDSVLVQEVTLDSIQHLDPKSYKSIEKALEKRAKNEKTAAEQVEARKKAEEAKLAAKKKKALAKALKLLTEEGIITDKEKKS